MLPLSVILSLTGLAATHAIPQSDSTTSERRAIINSYKIETAGTEFTTVGHVAVGATTGQKKTRARDVKKTNYVEIATAQIQEALPGATFRVIEDHYVGKNGVAHVHFQQTVDGLDVDNANFQVNILQDGTILSFGNSFHANTTSTPRVVRRDDAQLSPVAALRAAVKILQLPITGIENAEAESTDGGRYIISRVKGVLADPVASLAYIQKDDHLVLAWRLELDIGSNLLITYVDAVSDAAVAGVIDLTNAATYEAYPWGILNPDEGSRQLIVDPEDSTSSPLGWHNDGAQSYTTPRGNQIVTSTPSGSPPSSPSLIFSYPYSPSTADYASYIPASTAQGFYTTNRFHDILYALGFDEAAGNFQVTNHGKGGRENDPIQLSVQAGIGGGGVITTPVDGTSPRLTMYLFSGTPHRDATFDSTILLHEYMHAVSARLVGGPGTAGCFSNGNDGLSLTEGFSDFVPTLLRVKLDDTRADSDYTIAEWSTNTPLGLRSHYISTSDTRSPLTFATMNTLGGGGFDLATLWANALYEVFWNLADVHGIGHVDDVSLDAAGVPQGGARYLLLKLILDSQALTPCRPNHLQARDALVQADEILTGGVNRCAIWKGFAKRGFGTDAVRGSGTTSRVNGFAVPQGC